MPGVSVSISAGYHGKTEPVFSGVVLSQRVVVRRGSSWLEVECRDPAFTMTLVRRNRYFEDQSDSDVASHAARRLQRRRRVRGRHHRHDRRPSAAAAVPGTDWDFMISRLEAAGQICFVDAGKVQQR